MFHFYASKPINQLVNQQANTQITRNQYITIIASHLPFTSTAENDSRATKKHWEFATGFAN